MFIGYKTDDNSMDINQLSRRIRHYTLSRSENRFCKSDLFDICDGINSVLLEWTGCNYVGERKEKEKEKIYQDFFTSLSDLLAFYEGNREKISDIEQSFVDLLVYRGVVYRYLGIADIANASTQQIVKPEYNDIYVSWSKSTECYSYIRQKVYGPITRMQALIGGPLFGIDIHGFEDWCEIWTGKSSFITRGDEREIVFPTIEYCITEVKYLDCII